MLLIAIIKYLLHATLLLALLHVILTTITVREAFYLHLASEETDVQKHKFCCPGSHS